MNDALLNIEQKYDSSKVLKTQLSSQESQAWSGKEDLLGHCDRYILVESPYVYRKTCPVSQGCLILLRRIQAVESLLDNLTFTNSSLQL